MKDMVELVLICDRMDNDSSGALSLQEMVGDGGTKPMDNGWLMVDIKVDILVHSGQ